MSDPKGKTPSWWKVWYDLAWFAVVGWLTVWMLWGAETGREFVGAILGIILCVSLGAQLFAAVILRLTDALAHRREELEDALDEADLPAQHKPGPY